MTVHLIFYTEIRNKNYRQKINNNRRMHYCTNCFYVKVYARITNKYEKNNEQLVKVL